MYSCICIYTHDLLLLLYTTQSPWSRSNMDLFKQIPIFTSLFEISMYPLEKDYHIIMTV